MSFLLKKIDVAWEKNDNRFKIRISSPENIKKVLIIPDGEKHCFENAEFDMTQGITDAVN